MALQNTETPASFFSSPPLHLKKTSASKVRHRYEINHIRKDQIIQNTRLPSVNPYKDFADPLKSVKAFLKPCGRRNPRDKIQFTGLSQCPIPSGEEEYFFTIKLSPQRIRGWIGEGYSYVHFGAIRLGLTFHGREGFSVASRIALLDSRFIKYQPACFGVVETTLNAGTFYVTLFPNFTMSLRDKYSANPFQVHMQIVGAPMVPGLVQATLHSEMVYRVQDHAFDLPIHPYGDFPLIQVDSKYVTSITHIPNNISSEEFFSILPETWVTSFENRQTETKEDPNPNPTHLTFSSLIRNADGTVTMPSIRLNRVSGSSFGS